MTMTLTRQTSVADAEISPLHYRLAGLMCVTVLPALFWVMVIAYVGPLAGLQVTTLSLVLMGCAIGMFLAPVCAPLILKLTR